jgi:hypothetical protein
MHRHLPRPLIVAATAACLVASTAASAQARVGVYPSTTLAAQDVASLERAIAAQPGFEVVSLRVMLDNVSAASSIGVTCVDTSLDCLARIVAVAGLPNAVLAESIDDGGRPVLRLSLIDGSGDNRHRQVAFRVRASGPEREAGIGAGIAHLLTQAELTGGVALRPPPDANATVMVDGGRIFQADLRRLEAGRRTISVFSGGGKWEGEVEVLPGVTTLAELRQVEAPPDEALVDEGVAGVAAGRGEVGLPVLPVALLGAGVAVGAVGALAGALMIVLPAVLVPGPEQYRAAVLTDDRTGFSRSEADAYNDMVAQGRLLLFAGAFVLGVAVLAGGALAAGGGALWAFE